MATCVSTHCGAVEKHVGQFGRQAKTHPKIIQLLYPKSMKTDKKTHPKTTFFSTPFLDPFWETLGLVGGGFGEGFGKVLEGQGAPWVIWARHLFMLFAAMLPKRRSWRLLGSILNRFRKVWEGLGRVWGGFGESLGKDFGPFWAILSYYGICWIIGVFWADLCMIFAGAPCSSAGV